MERSKNGSKPAISTKAMSSAKEQQASARSRTDSAFSFSSTERFGEAIIPTEDATCFVDAFEAPARQCVLLTGELLQWQQEYQRTQQHAEQLPTVYEQEFTREHRLTAEQEGLRGK